MARPRTPLSRERVLRAGLELVDEEGLDALSMRKLAAALGVEAMSLYNHVANKDDIIAGMLDLVAGEIAPLEASEDWREALRARVVAAHQMFVRRPWAARIWMSGSSISHNRLVLAEATLRCLRDAGLPPLASFAAYHALDGYALGYALQRQEFDFTKAQLTVMATEFLEEFPADEHPEFAEHVRQHLDPSFAATDSFEFGLDLILDGLARLRVDGPRKGRRSPVR